MQIINQWHTFATPPQLAQSVCEAIILQAQQSIRDHGCFKLVLAGGSTPAQIYTLLAKQVTDWSKWFIYYGDERCLPTDHPQRNSVMAQASLLERVAIPAEQILTIPAELGNEQAAKLYQSIIVAAMPFDMVLLGMGEDGHTASLFPDQHYPPDEWVHAIFNAPKPPPNRVSLSVRALCNTQRLLFIITGSKKTAALQQWQNHHPLPVSMITPKVGVDIYLDLAALGGLNLPSNEIL